MGYSPWGRKESDTTERLTLLLLLKCLRDPKLASESVTKQTERSCGLALDKQAPVNMHNDKLTVDNGEKAPTTLLIDRQVGKPTCTRRKTTVASGLAAHELTYAHT